MGGASSHVCGCLPVAAGEFDFTSADACSSSASLPNVPFERPPLVTNTFGAGLCEDILDARKKFREKGRSTRELIVSALRANRLFASLEQSGLEELVDSFDYYSFDQTDLVVREGEVGSHVFVSDTAGLEVMLNGGHVAGMPRGRTFGELALLSNCPRSVSVRAGMPNVGVWGMHAQAFREALLKVMVGRLEDNRSFLDSVSLFKNLTMRQRDDVCDAARLRLVEVGDVLQLKDAEMSSDHHQMYLVKSGELQITSQDKQILRSGDVVGERTLLYGEGFNMEVKAITKAELLVVNIVHLRDILGDALEPVTLLRDDCLQSLQDNNSFASLDSNQQAVALKNLELQELNPKQETLAPPLFVVVDGSLQVGNTTLTKGMSFGEFPDMYSESGNEVTPQLSEVGQAGASPKSASPKSPGSPKFPPISPSIVAGPKGVRLASLTRRKVSMTLEELGVDLDEVGWDDEEHRRERMVAEIAKVCVFRHLPSYQIEQLVAGIVRQRYQRGDMVIREGDEECTHFYILITGQVTIKVGQDTIRNLSKYAYFGERALLFNEPRAASIEVTSDRAVVWALGVDTFKEVVQQGSQTERELLNRMRLQAHDILLRDLEPRDELGKGSFGIVTLVQHRKTGFMYALKQCKKSNVQAMEDVQREVEVLRENDHPFIMHLVKTFQTTKNFYMLTEYCSGGELHAAIRTIDFALTRPKAMFYVGSLVLILETLAERSIVYRDLKPENLMLDDKGYLKIIDFGTAKKLDPKCPRTNTQTGTPHYAAPEIFHESGYGLEVDIWSLGVILFELMCGELPFGNDLEDGPEVLDEVKRCEYTIPDGVESSGKDLIKKLLVFHPASRLGCGRNGFQELKKHRFFRLDGLKFDEILLGDCQNGSKHKDYFSMLLSRELKAPLSPSLRSVPDDFEAGGDYWPPSPTKSQKGRTASEWSIDPPLSIGTSLSISNYSMGKASCRSESASPKYGGPAEFEG